MNSLQRYKKPGGFNQLLTLIEGFGAQKRQKFLEMIEVESLAWANALREKIITVEKINRWPDEVILEVMKMLPEKLMVFSLQALAESRREPLMALFPQSEKRRITLVLSEGTPTTEEMSAAMNKFIETARRMINDRILQVDKFDMSLFIPAEFEAKIEAGTAAGEISLNWATAENLSEEVARGGAVVHLDEHRSELEKLKRRLMDLTAENRALKDEVHSLRIKLDQIRKIA